MSHIRASGMIPQTDLGVLGAVPCRCHPKWSICFWEIMLKEMLHLLTLWTWTTLPCPLILVARVHEGVLRPYPVFGSNRPLFGKCPVPRAGCQGFWTRSWSRELRNFLKSTLALRMFLPVSAKFNRSHECLSSLVSSTAVSRPVISIVAEHLSSMCSHLSSIRAASFSASFSSYLPYSRLQQDWACLKVPRSLTSKLMAGRSSTVCPFRFWKLTRELRSLGSSSISNRHSFPDQRPKLSSTEGGSPSITLIHPQNSARLPRIHRPQQASRYTPTFHLESNRNTSGSISMDVTHQGQWNDPADRPWCPRCRTVPVPSKVEHLLLGDNAEGNASSSHAVDLDHSSLSSHPCGTGARRQPQSCCVSCASNQTIIPAQVMNVADPKAFQSDFKPKAT
ncbi:uncharacterized protein [Vicugna pacos]|uniref:Uncharacterized protein n=1 Tax=Vicugna pacos TaxID=30538 RepID=A0ABM5CWV2_VICPA